ncbi:NAD-dependent epimerase/dehydratase family protein [Pelagibacterales bacterium SAG-MED38]|nr:NAD-dependent epimerase/dehydratase family protein [Pelagibacterales bacterium SAG-MED38]
MKSKKRIIITGTSGFIGFHVTKQLLSEKYNLIGIDNHNNYYNPKLKRKRLSELKKFKNFKFHKINIANKKKLFNLFKLYKPYFVINLAAQAGVRYSFLNPQKYIDSNITGFTNILEAMKQYNSNKLIYASSSSVYGDCKKFPFKENYDLNPLNFYGQTKLFNEKITKIYKKHYKIDSVGLRLFTVYGPYGRPDMFIPKIIDKIKHGKSIELFNNGNHYRDFTYVKDVAKIISLLIKKFEKPNKLNVYNICCGENISIKKVIKIIENLTNRNIKIINKRFQRGDMKKTHGANKNLRKIIKTYKFTNFLHGIKKTLKTDYF